VLIENILISLFIGLYDGHKCNLIKRSGSMLQPCTCHICQISQILKQMVVVVVVMVMILMMMIWRVVIMVNKDCLLYLLPLVLCSHNIQGLITILAI